MRRRADELPLWIVAVAVLLFVAHAANYLYFFVDDEAIPYVYAQNVLHGKGLSYNVLEGKLEGYSDFLHVGMAAVILAGSQAVHFPRFSVFFVGKALSLLCGIAILVVVWALLRRSRAQRTTAITALGLLALAGPLALWSCSSIEVVPFALGTMALVAALGLEWDGWTALAATFLILERIDGFVYASVLIGAFVFTATVARRREMLRRVILPVSVVFGLYHGWRWVYFRDFIPAPLEAKILYKLTRHSNLVVKAPDSLYLIRFTRVYGWPAAIALTAAAAHTLQIGGVGRRLTLAALPLVAYVALVGDWMFGFRFFVPLLPIFALIVASSVGSIARLRPRVAGAICLITLVYGGFAAARFFDTYVEIEGAPSFLRHPSRDLHRFFSPYYGLYEMARGMMPAGEVVAYNQAGFVPFMLDLNNIDDLGICSRFHADVPTTDLYFTEVGRYAPLTNKWTLRPGEAYLLYQNARFVMARTDILWRANHDTIPQALFGGYYELVGIDGEGTNAIYRRTERPATQFATSPRMFVENVSHVSYVRDARVDGQQLDPRDFVRRLPFLRDDGERLSFTGRLQIALTFSTHDEQVNGISVDEVRVNQPTTLQLSLFTRSGQMITRDLIELKPECPRSIWVEAPPGTAANRLTIDFTAAPDLSASARISDLRVMGQRLALESYISKHLRFPSPAYSTRPH